MAIMWNQDDVPLRIPGGRAPFETAKGVKAAIRRTVDGYNLQFRINPEKLEVEESMAFSPDGTLWRVEVGSNEDVRSIESTHFTQAQYDFCQKLASKFKADIYLTWGTEGMRLHIDNHKPRGWIVHPFDTAKALKKVRSIFASVS